MCVAIDNESGIYFDMAGNDVQCPLQQQMRTGKPAQPMQMPRLSGILSFFTSFIASFLHSFLPADQHFSHDI